jgi:hypothetical protein
MEGIGDAGEQDGDSMDAHRILQKARYQNIIKRYIIAIRTMYFQHPMRVRSIVNNSPENENASYSLAVADDIAYEATTYQLSCNQALLLTEFASCLSPCPSPNRQLLYPPCSAYARLCLHICVTNENARIKRIQE